MTQAGWVRNIVRKVGQLFLSVDTGDEFLRHVSRILKTCIRKDDILARIGGDEFAILLEQPLDSAVPIANELRESGSLGSLG